MTNQEIKLLIIRALGMPSRKSRAKGLERAFIANILITKDLREKLSPNDSLTLDQLMGESPLENPNDATPDCAIWVETNHPQLAEAFTQGAAIMEIIQMKKYWRELGFGSYEEFDDTIENESWLVSKVKELQSVNN